MNLPVTVTSDVRCQNFSLQRPCETVACYMAPSVTTRASEACRHWS